MTPDSRLILEISKLGPCRIESPVSKLLSKLCGAAQFIPDSQKAVFDTDINEIEKHLKRNENVPSLELAGPRGKIYFDPEQSSAAIVTCGGICPGINDVIRALVMTLYYRYGVKRILGIRYGYEGFIKSYDHHPMELTPSLVSEIHKAGGSFLGTSRGQQDTEEIVEFLEVNKINLLFVIGGDGTQRGALDIAKIAEARKKKISIIGIPKTIDNDILHMDQTFGFATAVAEAVKSISSAHTEALAQRNGIGLVKLMGRHSGFIACFAALGMNDANFVLIPEVPFELDGENGFLNKLKERLARRGHAVIIVAEGSGQKFFKEDSSAMDASGNVRLKDIGLYLKERINDYFKSQNIPVNLKYIDPSYIIRAIPASPVDSVYCSRLGQNAVHAAMSGRTKMVVGMRHRQYVHLPMELIASGRKSVQPNSDLWLSVLEATGQPPEMCNMTQSANPS